MRSEGKQMLLVEIASRRSSEYVKLTSRIVKNLIGKMLKTPSTSFKELKKRALALRVSCALW